MPLESARFKLNGFFLGGGGVQTFSLSYSYMFCHLWEEDLVTVFPNLSFFSHGVRDSENLSNQDFAPYYSVHQVI
jgi:hypothetical protein